METLSVSPNKCYELRAEVWEARNSLWVYSPIIWDVTLEQSAFRFKDEKWSVDSNTWLNASTVQLSLRKFPGSQRRENITVEVDCITRIAKILPSTIAKIDALEEALELALGEK
jgi:hypothetical protein